MSTILIPGPIELSDNVKRSFNSPVLAPADPAFVAIFQRVLRNTRIIFDSISPTSQPLILAGSGTLGWDIVGSNSIDHGDDVLLLSTGFFSHSFKECLTMYGANVKEVIAPLGGIVPLTTIEEELKSGKYKMICITHVDTSTAVLNDVQGISDIVKRVSPDTLIVVDAVCSIGCEVLKFDEWGIDFCLSASQKAIGAPPGLSISMASDRFIKCAENHKDTVFFTSLKRWIPILKAYEAGASGYFATLPVHLISVLDVALLDIVNYPGGLQGRIEATKQSSDDFKSKLKYELGLKLVSADEKYAAHGVTAVYVDEPKAVISYCKENNIVITGGIHKDIGTKCIRIGHMGVSACDPTLNHIPKCFQLIKESLQK